MYNKVNKLGLSCAKLSSNWAQLSQLRMAKGRIKYKLGTPGTGTKLGIAFIHLQICQNIVFIF